MFMFTSVQQQLISERSCFQIVNSTFSIFNGYQHANALKNDLTPAQKHYCYVQIANALFSAIPLTLAKLALRNIVPKKTHLWTQLAYEITGVAISLILQVNITAHAESIEKYTHRICKGPYLRIITNYTPATSVAMNRLVYILYLRKSLLKVEDISGMFFAYSIVRLFYDVIASLNKKTDA